MQIHELEQGSQEWLAHRANHFNASEAAAMLGLSKTCTRTELLAIKKTGIEKEFSDFVQRNVLDYGHEVEALVRPLIEEMIGEELYPVTVSNGVYSASLDGLTIDDKIGFECKQWNAEIAAQVAAGTMPEQHMPQAQQILMITGAKKVIFAVGDGSSENLLTLDVYPDTAWFERIKAGWAQFDADLKVFEPAPEVVKAVGRAPESLPALRLEVSGQVIASNIEEFKATALGAIRSVNRDLKSDQDFADNAKAIKWCQDIESRVKAAKDYTLGQTVTIEAAFRALDEIAAEARNVRLECERMDTAQKEAVRLDIIRKAQTALADHIAVLNAKLGHAYMPDIKADFGAAVKGKRSVDAMNDAVNTLLANTKVTADTAAARIEANLRILRELASGHKALFHDTGYLVLKQADDLTALIQARISEFEKEQAARLAAKAAADAAAQAEATIAAQAVSKTVNTVYAAIQGKPPAPADPIQTINPDTGEVFGYVPQGAVADADDTARLTLGQLNRRIAPVQISTEGLRTLGFPPAGNLRAAVLYRESDFEAMVDAIEKHMRAVRQANRATA
jgi:predicted phage-related endonuclease